MYIKTRLSGSEVRINPESIKEIRLYNKKLSTAITVIIVAGISLGLITWGIATCELDYLSGFSFSK